MREALGLVALWFVAVGCAWWFIIQPDRKDKTDRWE